MEQTWYILRPEYVLYNWAAATLLAPHQATNNYRVLHRVGLCHFLIYLSILSKTKHQTLKHRGNKAKLKKEKIILFFIILKGNAWMLWQGLQDHGFSQKKLAGSEEAVYFSCKIQKKQKHGFVCWQYIGVEMLVSSRISTQTSKLFRGNKTTKTRLWLTRRNE